MAEIQGLYKAEFMTPEHHGYGVLSISGGAARGGDSIMIYDGHYRFSGNDVTLDLEVTRHSHFRSMAPIFGKDSCTLNINGKLLDDGRIVGSGYSPEARNIPFKVILKKMRS